MAATDDGESSNSIPPGDDVSGLALSELERAALARVLSYEESKIAIADGDDHFVTLTRRPTSVEASCGCNSEVVAVGQNVVVLRRQRCRLHGSAIHDRIYAVLREGGLTALDANGRDAAAPFLHPVQRRSGMH